MREQVAISIVLRDLKEHIRGRHIDNVLDAEQQIEFLTDADVKVLNDLCFRQCAVVFKNKFF